MELHEGVKSYLWALFMTYMTVLAVDASLDEVQRHLDLGKTFLSKGQFSDALTHYHAAVDLDPENYQTLYRRATVYLAMGKSKAAIPDLDRVIQLKPDFSSARLQRANVHLKQGDLDSAYVDYEAVLSKDAANSEALLHVSQIEPAQRALREADFHFEQGDLESAEHFYTQVIEVSPWDSELRQRRAKCYEATGQLQKAIADIRSITKLEQDSTEAFLRLSQLYYQLADMEESLKNVRECLKLNPDHKECFPHYKKVKKLFGILEKLEAARKAEDWGQCVDRVKEVVKLEANNPALRHQLNQHLCRCHSKNGNINGAIKLCEDVLSVDPNNIDAYCDRAEAYIGDEKLDEALQDYQKASQIDENSQRAREGVNKVQKLLKQASKKDYYKILNVKRSATKSQIIKAYRTMAKTWHPDQYQGDDKKMAEKKFIDIASAKEVLTDPDKRARFDQGEDPLDPEQQQGGRQHPFFHQGFDPFGGGGFQFKFHYN